MSRFGNADTSQCDTLEPGWSGFGSYIRMRFVGWLSVPASFEASSDSVALTGPGESATLIALPSDCESAVTGIVTVGDAPRRGGSGPATLLMMITPIAPFACAFAACCAIK